MKFVIQRVKTAKVDVDGATVGKIEKGFMVLIGVCQSDTRATADKMVKKLVNMRIFEDENGKTNLSLADVNGQLLLISQFTLYADCKKGTDPASLMQAAPIWPMNCMNISLQNVENLFRMCRKVFLGRIWMFR